MIGSKDPKDPEELIQDVLKAIETAMNIETMQNIALFLMAIEIPEERQAEVKGSFVKKVAELGLTQQVRAFLANWKAERIKA